MKQKCLKDIQNYEEIDFCDGLSNFHFNANEYQLQELLNELSVEFHINPRDENEIRQIMLTSGLVNIDERMECIYLIKDGRQSDLSYKNGKGQIKKVCSGQGIR